MNILMPKKFIRNSEKKDFGAIFLVEKARQKKHKKNSVKNIAQKTKDEENNPKTKSLIAFDASLSCSVKCLAVKKMKQLNQQLDFSMEKC